MLESQLLSSYISSNLVALVMLALCLRWQQAGRMSFMLLFLWAGFYDLWTAIVRPEEYLAFARLSYSSLIVRFTLQHTTAVLAAIALGQLAIGFLISLRGSAVKLGLWGVVFFLVGMAPLADADGFFARLIKVCAALLLLRVPYDSTLWSELAELLPPHSHAHSHEHAR